jgi:hypothetical protein
MIFYVFVCYTITLINLVKTNTIPQTQASQFVDDNDTNHKNDNAHFRLFYKANSPTRTVSHAMEHRYVKHPDYTSQQQNLNQFKQQQLQRDYLQRMNNLFANNQNQNSDENNKNIVFNMQYHKFAPSTQSLAGNSLPYQTYSYNYPQQQQQQQSSYHNNILKMLLNNFAANSQNIHNNNNNNNRILSPQLLSTTGQSMNPNSLNYKIVHLKFKMEPQVGSNLFK